MARVASSSGRTIPSLTDQVAKMSTRTGLIYAVTRKYDTEAPGYEDPGLDVYYFSAINFRTGSVV